MIDPGGRPQAGPAAHGENPSPRENRHDMITDIASYLRYSQLERVGETAVRAPASPAQSAVRGEASEGGRSLCLVPVTEDALALWDTWVGMGGEGIVLKERASAYRPGLRSPAWLKLKPKLTLTATVTGGSSERIAWVPSPVFLVAGPPWIRPCRGDTW
jgi:bifunctional non-homologous end joining protein LigD